MWCLRGELGWGWEPRAHWRTMAGESGTVAILRRLLANLELRGEQWDLAFLWRGVSLDIPQPFSDYPLRCFSNPFSSL